MNGGMKGGVIRVGINNDYMIGEGQQQNRVVCVHVCDSM